MITTNGQQHTLEITRQNGLSCRLDGAAFPAEIAEAQPGVYSVLIEGKSFQARVAPSADSSSDAGGEDASHYSVQIDGTAYAVSIRDPRRWLRDRSRLALAGKQQIVAPMPGKVIRILVAENQRVEAGEGLIVVEAMKMQNEIKSSKRGRVEKVLVRPGQTVNAGEPLLIVE